MENYKIAIPCLKCRELSFNLIDEYCVERCYCFSHNGAKYCRYLRKNQCSACEKIVDCACLIYCVDGNYYCINCRVPICINGCYRPPYDKCKICDKMVCDCCQLCHDHQCPCGAKKLERIVIRDKKIISCGSCIYCEKCTKNVKRDKYTIHKNICVNCCDCDFCIHSIVRIAPAFRAFYIIMRRRIPRPLIYMIFNFMQGV